MTVLLDASAVLAAILDEPGGDVAHDAMADAALAVVNHCEVLSRLAQGGLAIGEALSLVQPFELRLLAFDANHAAEAARLRPVTSRHGPPPKAGRRSATWAALMLTPRAANVRARRPLRLF